MYSISSVLHQREYCLRCIVIYSISVYSTWVSSESSVSSCFRASLCFLIFFFISRSMMSELGRSTTERETEREDEKCDWFRSEYKTLTQQLMNFSVILSGLELQSVPSGVAFITLPCRWDCLWQTCCHWIFSGWIQTSTLQTGRLTFMDFHPLSWKSETTVKSGRLDSAVNYQSNKL